MQIRFEPLSLRSLPQARFLERLLQGMRPSGLSCGIVVTQSMRGRPLSLRIRGGKKTVTTVMHPHWFFSDSYEAQLASVVVALFADFAKKPEEPTNHL